MQSASDQSEQLNVNLLKLIQKYFEVINDVLSNIHLFKIDIPGFKTLSDINNKAWAKVFNDPINIMKSSLDYQLKLWQHTLTIKNHIELAKALHKELFFYYQNLIQNTELNEKDRQYILFFIKQFLNAIAPDNFFVLNDKVLSACANSNFQTLINGLDNLQRDLKNSQQFFNICNVNKLAFNLGENLAATEGKVVYRNELIELICYKPAKKVFNIPILIVPPCINRYYVLDLSKNNSFIKWLVDNNFQVFLISWVNPKSKEQNFAFEEYIKLGILQAGEYISQNFGYKKINPIGYCIGGTMLATALAHCARKKMEIFNSATFLNTMLDFSDHGEISIFIRDEIISYLKTISNNNGYLDGIYLYNVFNLLKSKDLIWYFYINNYLEGNLPKAFDILYWNADYVNLPAKMFDFYLTKIYLENLLVKPNKLQILGTKIDLTKISVPSFFVASKNDHIVPWEQSYLSTRYLKGDKTFCLAASGHVAGIVNPPSNDKYGYWAGDIKNTSQEWLDSATKLEGSWWPAYLAWLQKHSGELGKPCNYAKLGSLAAAPGTYCKT
jgi:polyhydroxyalkanoate synthase